MAFTTVFTKAFRFPNTMAPQAQAPKKGDEIIINSGVYVGMKGWIDPKGKKMKTMAYVIVEVEDEDGEKSLKYTKIKKSNFIVKKLKKAPTSITQKLLEGQPQVAKDLNTVAKNMARLGVTDGRESAEIFLALVNHHIEALKKKGPKANYFPIQLEEGMYRAFYDNGPNPTVSDARAAALKRTYDNPDAMNNDSAI